MPTAPIGFLGLIPICIFLSKLIELVVCKEADEDEVVAVNYKTRIRNVAKVATITFSNGADNISVYVPLFAQANGEQLGIYIAIFLVLLGVWCLAGYLLVKHEYIQKLMQRYMHLVLPFLFLGLGLYIIINSDCYPWTIEKINQSTSSNTGSIIIPIITVVLLVSFIILSSYLTYRKTPPESFRFSKPQAI
ncbi:hypothetical protein DM01DRAFT_1334914 [Hesseltinella vesiculosa]|uniref:Cadmium resistance transporter n=1 Tax=Hesseltinella vesiculosa TaxID=101127 RepID=A0A1X2GLE8_9FUNG|nr:hypothetical protein DM01DRAFT_1334914 [Hesseltinella vesiculosa]